MRGRVYTYNTPSISLSVGLTEGNLKWRVRVRSPQSVVKAGLPPLGDAGSAFPFRGCGEFTRTRRDRFLTPQVRPNAREPEGRLSMHWCGVIGEP